MHKSKIFFISDHETGFNNIYSLTIDNLLLEAKVTDRYDHFLANNSFFLQDTLTYIKNMGLYFLSNVDKAPRDGVIYDYMAKNDSLLLLYASPEKPASLYLVSDSGLVDILQQKVPTKNYDVVIESRENGVDNLLFLPNETKQWVVWLHGGPHEQVSYRFNPYIHHLASNNIGVIALNYPGSTGLGNKFEIRNISQKDRLEIQLEAIKQDLAIFVDKYGIDSFSLVGVSYGSILAHHLAGDRGFNVKKLVDFSGVNVSENLVGSNIEVMYIMGDLDFILSNPYRVSLLNEHKKKGAKTLILEEDGHSISRNKNISKTIDVMLNFLADY